MTKRTLRLNELHEIELEGGPSGGFRLVFNEYDNGNVVRSVTIPMDPYDGVTLASKLGKIAEGHERLASGLRAELRIQGSAK